MYCVSTLHNISTLYLHIYLETGVTAGELLPLEGIIRSRHAGGAWAAHSDIRRAVEMADLGKCFCLFQDNRSVGSTKITQKIFMISKCSSLVHKLPPKLGIVEVLSGSWRKVASYCTHSCIWKLYQDWCCYQVEADIMIRIKHTHCIIHTRKI